MSKFVVNYLQGLGFGDSTGETTEIIPLIHWDNRDRRRNRRWHFACDLIDDILPIIDGTRCGMGWAYHIESFDGLEAHRVTILGIERLRRIENMLRLIQRVVNSGMVGLSRNQLPVEFAPGSRPHFSNLLTFVWRRLLADGQRDEMSTISTYIMIWYSIVCRAIHKVENSPLDL